MPGVTLTQANLPVQMTREPFVHWLGLVQVVQLFSSFAELEGSRQGNIIGLLAQP